MLNISQEILDEEVTGMDEYICIMGVEISENINTGDNRLDKRINDIIFLINIRSALIYYDVDSTFLDQDNIRYLINQAKKVISSIELPDNSIYQ